jgi:hypothetical protein
MVAPAGRGGFRIALRVGRFRNFPSRSRNRDQTFGVAEVTRETGSVDFYLID